MLHVYEFELFKDGDLYLAIPYDMAGGTQGETIEEVCHMAADWLQTEMEYRDMDGEDFPEATFGNEPKHGGQTLIVAVNAGRDTVKKVSASDAARMLDVTPGRVTQMIAAGYLHAFKEGHKTWVTVDSINARLAEKPKAGRPRKLAV